MRTLGNTLWLIFGGLVMALGYTISGLIMFVFIITIPFGIQSFKLASYDLWPFREGHGPDPGEGWLSQHRRKHHLDRLLRALAGSRHLFWALLLAITIVGIPFAIANVKLAGAALVPFGRTVMSAEQAEYQSYEVVLGIELLG